MSYSYLSSAACLLPVCLCSSPSSSLSVFTTNQQNKATYDASCSFLLTSSKFSTKSGTSSSSSPPAPPAAALACAITACRSGRPPSLAANDEYIFYNTKSKAKYRSESQSTSHAREGETQLVAMHAGCASMITFRSSKLSGPSCVMIPGSRSCSFLVSDGPLTTYVLAAMLACT